MPMKGDLHIQASFREGITYLEQGYFSPPFKLATIAQDKNEPWLHLVLMSSSPGILDGDGYSIKIELDAGCSLQLHTQSYQRLFNMQTGATQNTEVILQEGACFVYLPHPAVPHQNSVFTSTNNIYITDHCRLVWGEILTCGRKGNGEVFHLAKYHNLTSIYFNTKLIIKENLLIQPELINPSALGQMENYTHQASLVLIDRQLNLTEMKEQIAAFCSVENEIDFGVTNLPVHGLLVRILGNKAEQLYKLLQSIKQLSELQMVKQETVE